MLHSQGAGAIVAAEGVLSITLEDDGKGIDLAVRRNHNGRGLSNIISRASLIEAHAVWQARPGGGTVFRLLKQVRLKPM
jgi:signal transduction histidine kinase